MANGRQTPPLNEDQMQSEQLLKEIELNEQSPVSSNNPQAAIDNPTQMPDEASVNAFLDSVTDQATGDFLPAYANGLDKNAAINRSPVDAIDRLKLAFGDEEGNMQFLKQRFDAVDKDENGNLVVQSQGKWHRVDPGSMDNVDAWTRTTELIGDIADIAPTIGTIGGSLALGAATGGASLVAQAGAFAAFGAGTAAARTSLGRLVGTYEASTEDQLKEVAFESLLNVGGTVIGAGVRPTVSMISKNAGAM